MAGKVRDIGDKRRQRQAKPASGLPTIETSARHLRDMSSDAMRALTATATGGPIVLRRGSEIVRPVTGHAEVEAVSGPALKGILDRCANWVATDKTTGEERARRPPLDVVQDLLALPAESFALPPLHGIAAAPIFLPDGRLLAEDGYDKGSGYLVRLDGLGPVRTDIPVDRALALLRDELLEGFPFVGDGAKAHTLAMLLQPFVRPMISGPTPLYMVDAPSAGTGKGLLIGAASVVAQGHEVPAGAMIGDDAETEKRITALLLSGAGIILLDEAHELGSPALASALTATTWRGRRLGKSETVALPNLALWCGTANNVRLLGDMPRRVVPIRLDAQEERPEFRTDFKHKKLKLWARGERPALVSACLSLVQHWVDDGAEMGEDTLGSYESWAGVLGGILKAAGIDGFLTGREYLYGEADDEAKDWAALVNAWRKELGTTPATAAFVHSLARRLGLLTDLWAGRTTLAGQQRVGRALQKVRDRVFGELRIRYAGRDAHTGSAAYRVECTSSDARGNEETPETPDTTGALEPQDLQDRGFSGVSAPEGGNPGRGFSVAQDETPEKPRAQGPSLPGTSVVSGVSGVLNRPPGPRATADNSDAKYLAEERAAIRSDGAGDDNAD